MKYTLIKIRLFLAAVALLIISCSKDHSQEGEGGQNNSNYFDGSSRVFIVYEDDESLNPIVSVTFDKVVMPVGKKGTHSWIGAKIPPLPSSIGQGGSLGWLVEITYGETLSGENQTVGKVFYSNNIKPGLNLLLITREFWEQVSNYAHGIPNGKEASVSLGDINNITSNSAKVHGFNILSNGSEILEKGICWSEHPNSGRNDKSISVGSDDADFVAQATNLNPFTTYYFRAFVTTIDKTYYSDEEKVIKTTLGILDIGQKVAGGTVGYILKPGDFGYDPNIQHGLIISDHNYSSAKWGCYGSIVNNTKIAIGYGKSNTAKILTSCPNSMAAAYMADTYTKDGYSDWYLPSLQELMSIRQNIDLEYNTSYSYYWTSSQGTDINNFELEYKAFAIDLSNGMQLFRDKNESGMIRAIRSF